MKEQINKKICMTTIILIILSISFISAFGVSTSYWKGNPLSIAPGDTKTISLRLQNIGTDDDITVRAVLTDGFEIASTEEKNYLVRAGTKDTEVPVKISIPLDTPLGTEYRVTVSFKTITPGGTGGVVLGTAIDTSFDVLVAEVEAEEGVNVTLIVISLILIIAIFILIYIFRKKIFNKK